MKLRHLLLASVFLLTACTDKADDTTRLEAMKSEPIVAAATGVSATAGFQESDRLAPRRGSLTATLADVSPATPDAARHSTADAVGKLGPGWTVYFVACAPAGSSDPMVPPANEGWRFLAYAYKHNAGVSYFAWIDGSVADNGRAVVRLTMYAPYSGESTSDLFADRPPAVTSGCLTQPAMPDKLTTSGTAVVVDASGGTKPSGHR
jgi:hypothetical protein